MRIILFGHQNWGVKAIEAILNTRHELIHVFTHPEDYDKNEKVWYSSVEESCKKNDIPFSICTKIEKDDSEKIRNLKPDLIMSIGWRRLIPKSVFQIPRFKTINLHDGLLPQYRGFAPINWAIINGETEIGVTIHYIDESADTGDIILQKQITIDNEKTAKEAYDELLDLSSTMIHQTIELIENGNVVTKKQKPNEGFFCSRRFPEDGKINWNESRTDIFNLIRALSDPYPNAYCNFNEKIIHIKKARLTDQDFRGPPGRICSINDDGIVVTCGMDFKKNQGLLISQISINNQIINPKDFFTKLWSKVE